MSEFTELIYPELSYKINGVLFSVQNELGRFCNEKQYCDAIEGYLKKLKVSYEREKVLEPSFENEQKGRNKTDFIIEDKIILEIKRGDRFAKIHIDQVLQYLSINKLKLGILAYFAPRKLHYKRLVNL